jgi:preprotein translocase subunit Sec63
MNIRTAREVLGLAEGFTPEELRRARRSLMQQFHPDKFATSSPRVQAVMEAEFKRVDSAYQLLSRYLASSTL